MPRFHYTAKRGPNDVVEGTLEAENRGGVLAYLTQLGYVPVRVSEWTAAPVTATPSSKRQPRFSRIGRVPSREVTVFTRQFASLVRSAVPLLRTLKILEDQARHPVLRQTLSCLAEEVRQGQTLSSALAQFPSVFSPLYVNLIRSGEVSGALDVVLEHLAQQAEQEEATRARIRMAMTYPAFVALVGVLTVVFLMTFVMPRLSRLLIGLGEKLPLATRLLLAASDVLSSGAFWGLLAAAGLIGALLWKGMGERGRFMLDRLVLRLPLLGTLVKQSEMARFARSFGLQIRHGIAILQAIEVSVSVISHRVIRRTFERLPEGLRQGESLSSCLKASPISTPFLINTVAVGEETGRVGEALTEVAQYYEGETERLLQRLATLLEPLLIVGVGVVVGFIVMAVLLPIFEMGAVGP